MEKQIGTLIKTFKGYRVTENGNKYDTLMIIYKDENDKKKTMFYDRPTMEYYTIKDKNSKEADHPPLYIERDKLEKHETYSDNIYRDIAVNTGALSYYDRIRINYGQNSYNMKNLFKSSLLYAADTNIEDQYIAKFYKQFEPKKNFKAHKSYFDIENDIYHYTGFPTPEIAPCPVCLVTLIDEPSMQSYTFILRNKENPSLTQFETEVEDFKKYMHEKIIANDDLQIDFNFIFFDSEIELIKSFFAKVHELDPDYCSGWNISFDIPTLQNRLTNLYKKNYKTKNESKNVAINDICNDAYMVQKNSVGKDFYINPRAYYSIGFGKFGRRTDSYNVLDGTNWIDQMLTYATIHFQEGKTSYALDNIANIQLGKEKLPYDPGETIRNLLYKNARKFVEYNIRDVLLLLEIENKTKDLDMLQQLSDITVTRKDKVFKKSISLTNFINRYADEQNLVMKTNKNTNYADKNGDESNFYNVNFMNNDKAQEYNEHYVKLFDTRDKFGAFVSDPNDNSDVGYELYEGKPSMFIFEYVCDEDFRALYPSTIEAFNLDATNIIGKFYVIDNELKTRLKQNYDCAHMFKLSIKDEGTKSTSEEDPDDDDDLDIDDVDSIEKEESKAETEDLCCILSDSLISKDWNMIGKNFFDLPSTSDMVKEIRKAKGLVN